MAPARIVRLACPFALVLARKIASFKIPRYVRFVGEFPMTVTGKIQKFKMREVSVEELGLAGD